MSLVALCFWYSVLYLVHAQNETTDQSSCTTLSFKYVDDDMTSNINITEACNKNICITKCCPPNQILFHNLIDESVWCGNNTELTDEEYWKVDIYGVNIKENVMESKRKLKQFTRIYSENVLDCSMYIEDIFPPPVHRIYILEDGTLIVRRVNYYNQWLPVTPPGQFCVDRQIVAGADGSVSESSELAIRIFVTDDYEASSDQKIAYKAYGMLVSSFFLVLVLVVYALLPQLRNLAGMMLMSYVATLTTAFVFRAMLVIGTDHDSLSRTACLYVGFIFYYTILASFTWMNVMSFDIWWSMRGFRKLQEMPRHGVLVKFGWYSLYAWGAPLIPVLFIVIVDPMDLTDLPYFIKPHLMDKNKCFMEEDERQLYMIGPILIATCANITLFLMTAYNIWQIKKRLSEYSAGESKKEKNRFCIYLKLSLVMGINWILEVAGSLYQADSALWFASDVFNSLIGLFIFIIFICKKHIVVLLCKRFSTGNALVRILQHLDSTRTLSSRLNQDGKY